MPAAAEQPTERSVFMDIYAAQARYHMACFGSTVEQFAIVAAKNHDHSQHNPYAQYRFSLTKEEVLADRIVSWPMTRSMCAPMSDGAAALIVVSKRALTRFPDTRPVRIRGMGLTVGTDRTTDAYDRHVTRLAAERAYEQAGLGPEDIHVAEVHDASAVAEIIQGEHLGFWAYGEGAPRTATGESKLGGKRPINVSGGLLSKGHPIGATGAIQIHDLLRQLRGEAGPSQVGGARIALAENGGGFYGLEEAVCAVTILEAGSGAAR